MSTVADYANRTIDILAFRGQRTSGVAALVQSLIDPDSGEVCAGITKLCQRWLIKFLQPLGSMPFLPDRGCSFQTLANTGQFRTELDVINAFQFATLRITPQMLTEEVATLPDDERFQSAALGSLTLSPGSLQLSISITSQAGANRVILLPISIVPVAMGN